MGLFHRGKKNNDDEPDSVQTNSFSDIMNGLQYAVNCAQDTLQYLQLIISQYFISNKSGIWSLSLIVHSKG